MTYRDILVQMNETPDCRARAAAAADLARRSGGVATGVFLTSEFLDDIMATEVLAYMTPADIDTLLKDHANAVERAAENARQIFEAAAAEADVKSEWLTVRGSDDRELVACSRRCDLLVLPPKVRVSLARWRYGAGDLAMASGGPVLVVPPQGCAPEVGRRVLVAWNGSREAARALRDAWPVLQAAERVDVVAVSAKGEGPERWLQRHLERHGCEANVIVDRSDDIVAGEVLRGHMADLGSDLLVMGLFGRSRLQEFILGGVSSDMLADPPVPLLLSH